MAPNSPKITQWWVFCLPCKALATRSHRVLSSQTADPTFTVHVVDIEDTNMRVGLCIFDVPGDLYCRESSLKLVRADHHAHRPLSVAALM